MTLSRQDVNDLKKLGAFMIGTLAATALFPFLAVLIALAIFSLYSAFPRQINNFSSGIKNTIYQFFSPLHSNNRLERKSATNASERQGIELVRVGQ